MNDKPDILVEVQKKLKLISYDYNLLLEEEQFKSELEKYLKSLNIFLIELRVIETEYHKSEKLIGLNITLKIPDYENRYEIYYTVDKKKNLNKYKDINNKEWLVYILDSDNCILENKIHHTQISDNDFIIEAEKQGSVYSLKGFEEAFNLEFINDQDIIRILYV